MTSPFLISNVITFSTPVSKNLAILPKGVAIENIYIYVDTAFDGGITLSVGYAANHTAYCSAQAVSSTGPIRPAIGSGGGRDTTPRQAAAYFGGGTPTQGKAIIVMTGFLLAPSV